MHMPNSYNSIFTGQHNDDYDVRITAVEAFGDRITNLENKLATYSYNDTDNTVSINSTITNGTQVLDKSNHIWCNNGGLVLGSQDGHLWMQHNDTTWPILQNYYNSNLTFNAPGGELCIGYANTNSTLIGDQNAKRFIIASNGQAQREGFSSTWIEGRKYAMIRTTSCPGYSAAISIKTNSGSWQLGSYSYSGWYDKLSFTYTTDANFNSNTNNSVNATITTAGAFANASKRELKENIEDFKASGLNIINSIKICSFNMKGDPEKDYRIGFIADDTDERVAGKNHDIMDLQNCIGVMMKAIQELSQEIDELKKRLGK